MAGRLLPPAFAPGSVWLVGAGPGDPGLLTLHALHALEQAEVILHDALIAPEILALAGADARLEGVGKRAGQPSARQLLINQRLITLARADRRVVRLKGGDPFVFGRGGEEALALAAAGIPFRIVPGISAGLAAPAAAGIPVTHRTLAQTVAFVTGHNAGGGAPRAVDWRALAKAAQTIVVYMGGQRLPEIARALLAAGRAADEPVAILSEATTPRARRELTTLGAAVAPAPHATGGATLIVIGQVAELGALLAPWQTSAPAGVALPDLAAPDDLSAAQL
jgi:uroporphyrin-III C-methyltransferase